MRTFWETVNQLPLLAESYRWRYDLAGLSEAERHELDASLSTAWHELCMGCRNANLWKMRQPMAIFRDSMSEHSYGQEPALFYLLLALQHGGRFATLFPYRKIEPKETVLMLRPLDVEKYREATLSDLLSRRVPHRASLSIVLWLYTSRDAEEFFGAPSNSQPLVHWVKERLYNSHGPMTCALLVIDDDPRRDQPRLMVYPIDQPSDEIERVERWMRKTHPYELIRRNASALVRDYAPRFSPHMYQVLVNSVREGAGPSAIWEEEQRDFYHHLKPYLVALGSAFETITSPYLP